MLPTPTTRIYHKFTEQTELIISQKLRSAIYKLKYFIHFFVFYIIWMKISEEKLFEIYQHSMISQWHGNDKYKHNLSPFLLKRISPGKLSVKKRGCRSQNRSESYIQNRVTNVTKKEKKEEHL